MNLVIRFFIGQILLTLFQLPATSAQNLPDNYFSNRFISREPTITISSDGMASLIIETETICSGGEAFFGVYPDSAGLPFPFYRMTGEVVELSSNTLEVRFDLTQLSDSEVDINGIATKRWQNVPYRLSLFGDKLHTIDRNFSFAIDEQGNYQRIAGIVEGPFVDLVTDSSAVISWDFDRSTEGNLIVSDQRPIPFGKRDTHHEIKISGLRTGQEYQYQIVYSTQAGEKKTRLYHFKTAPELNSNNPFRFAVFSDTRATVGQGDRSVERVNAEAVRELSAIAYQQNSDFVLIPGDLVSGYISDPSELAAEYRSFKRIISPVGAHIPIYEGLGNHDLVCRFIGNKKSDGYLPRTGNEATEVIFAEHFVNPENGPRPSVAGDAPYTENVYSLDWGNSHFVSLNNDYMKKSNDEELEDEIGYRNGWLTKDQIRWLSEDLKGAKYRGLKHIFVYLHEPAFPNGGHVGDSMWWGGKIPEVVEMRRKFWSILSEHHVLAVLCGHEHNFSLTKIDETVDPAFKAPVWQIVTGGGGAPFYAQDKNTPWADQVKYFYPLTHLCLIDVAGDDVTLHVVTDEGQTIKSIKLTE